MSSICPKCAYLSICEALHKDSIVKCEDYKNIVQTNFDRLQTMSINELATWLTDFCCATVGNAADARVAMYHCGLREWLEQEATE